jgi:hypothetical protein
MMGQGRLTLPDDRFAQAGQVEARGKRGAKAHLINKAQGLALRLNPARREAAKMEVTMAFEAPGQIGLRYRRANHRTQRLIL